MAKTVTQSVRFAAPAASLYALYMDAKLHAGAIGAPVSISRRPGSRFSAFGGAIVGRTVAAVPGRMIVQIWRSTQWPKTALDSVLVLTFSDGAGGGRVDMVHANVPDGDYAAIKGGWTKYYWKPWRSYLARTARRPARRR
jgi:activator of HSP90 ATPase